MAYSLSADKKRGFEIVRKMIKKAEKERDTKGYRENLGHDQYPVLMSQLYLLDLSYQDQVEIVDYWADLCDAL